MFRIAVLAVLVLSTLLVAAPAGAPVQVSYVYSDSMEPTIGVGDGYVVVPAGDVESGDIVTFWSAARGDYTTHRVVGETSEGYLTRGDNNPVSDQRAGYPPVARDAIVGEVLTWNGDPVLLPGLGRAVGAARENAAVLLGALAAAGLLGARRDAPVSERPERARSVVYPLLVAALLGTAAVVAFGGASHSETFLAVEDATATGSASTLAVGTAQTVSYAVGVADQPWATRVVHTTGLHAVETTRNATAVTVTGTVRAPATPGPVPAEVAVRSYPAVLPHGTVARLDATHPLLAAFACTALAFAPLFALVALAVDGGERLRASRSRLRRLLVEGFE
ncbi:signal peptidase I (plasmid) [Halarchaeum sp. CBA1220]|uniref:signal peptidase I n=1 Tax=Halarchaeum sp. CBA1220 TaxID=1853682 RepID=UPI000F3A89E2|nr:signal peptidase I [Halarchaeum sp. CBA1220]QLC34832.1 signal peptidase I [Halarchaeum sp. CBA1220]